MDMIRSFGSENIARKGAESGSIRRNDFGAEDLFVAHCSGSYGFHRLYRVLRV